MHRTFPSQSPIGACPILLFLFLGAFVSVVDVGIDSDVPLGSAFVADGCTVRDAKVARGTADFRKTAAISQDQLALAITAGRAAVDAELDERGAKLVLVGEASISPFLARPILPHGPTQYHLSRAG